MESIRPEKRIGQELQLFTTSTHPPFQPANNKRRPLTPDKTLSPLQTASHPHAHADWKSPRRSAHCKLPKHIQQTHIRDAVRARLDAPVSSFPRRGPHFASPSDTMRYPCPLLVPRRDIRHPAILIRPFNTAAKPQVSLCPRGPTDTPLIQQPSYDQAPRALPTQHTHLLTRIRQMSEQRADIKAARRSEASQHILTRLRLPAPPMLPTPNPAPPGALSLPASFVHKNLESAPVQPSWLYQVNRP